MRGVVFPKFGWPPAASTKPARDFGLNPDKGTNGFSWIAGTLVYVVALLIRTATAVPSMPWRSRRFQGPAHRHGWPQGWW